MNPLTVRERELVALGAALGSNCIACVKHHVAEARAAGIAGPQIEEALELADAVRSVSAREALNAATAASLGAAAGDDEPQATASACAQRGRPPRRCC